MRDLEESPNFRRFCVAAGLTIFLTPPLYWMANLASSICKHFADARITQCSVFNDGYTDSLLHKLNDIKQKDPEGFMAAKWCVTPRAEKFPGKKDQHTLGFEVNGSYLGELLTVAECGRTHTSENMSAEAAYLVADSHNKRLLGAGLSIVKDSTFPVVTVFSGKIVSPPRPKANKWGSPPSVPQNNNE